MKWVYWGKHIISNAFISISSNKDVAKEANDYEVQQDQ